MLSRSHRGLLALIICGSVLLLSGCGTGFGAQTSQMYDAGSGTNHREGDIEILNALFVDNGDETATLSTGVINNAEETDSIESVSATAGGDDVTVELRSPVELPHGDLVSVGTEPSIVLPDGGFQNGYLVHLTLTFQNAAPIEIDVPVEARTSAYESVATPAPAKKSG